jgi:hypothetical protein
VPSTSSSSPSFIIYINAQTFSIPCVYVNSNVVITSYAYLLNVSTSQVSYLGCNDGYSNVRLYKLTTSTSSVETSVTYQISRDPGQVAFVSTLSGPMVTTIFQTNLKASTTDPIAIAAYQNLSIAIPIVTIIHEIIVPTSSSSSSSSELSTSDEIIIGIVVGVIGLIILVGGIFYYYYYCYHIANGNNMLIWPPNLDTDSKN